VQQYPEKSETQRILSSLIPPSAVQPASLERCNATIGRAAIAWTGMRQAGWSRANIDGRSELGNSHICPASRRVAERRKATNADVSLQARTPAQAYSFAGDDYVGYRQWM
jgi:hypothetical protein